MLREDWYLRDRLKLRHLQILVTLASARNLSQAARLLHTTQPALSKALGELERMLGVSLFERLPKGLAPTMHCLGIVERAREVLGSLGRMREDLDAVDTGVAGVLNIGANTSATALLLPHIILRIKSLLPGLTVRVHDGAFEDLMAGLRANRLDFLLGRFHSAEYLDNVENIGLFNVRMVAVCANGHPILKRRRITLAQLAQWPWILPPGDGITRRGLELIFMEAGGNPPRFGVECASVLANMVIMQNSHAMALAALPTASLFASSGQLSIVPVTLPPVFGRISLLHLRDRPLHARDKLFMDCVQSVSAQLGESYLTI